MITAWRIVKRKHSDQIWTGEGTRLLGGRWNSPGHAVVHTAENRALAHLECLVHFERQDLLSAYVIASATFDDGLVEILDRDTLPDGWTVDPAGPATQTIGDAWLTRASSAVLAVPSAVVEGEQNFLLNPRHKQFRKIKLSPPRPVMFDPRLSQ